MQTARWRECRPFNSNYQKFGDITFPTKIVIQRPLDELGLTITVTKATFNQLLLEDQFNLGPIPENDAVQNMDDPVSAATPRAPHMGLNRSMIRSARARAARPPPLSPPAAPARAPHPGTTRSPGATARPARPGPCSRRAPAQTVGEPPRRWPARPVAPEPAQRPPSRRSAGGPAREVQREVLVRLKEAHLAHPLGADAVAVRLAT